MCSPPPHNFSLVLKFQTSINDDNNIMNIINSWYVIYIYKVLMTFICNSLDKDFKNLILGWLKNFFFASPLCTCILIKSLSPYPYTLTHILSHSLLELIVNSAIWVFHLPAFTHETYTYRQNTQSGCRVYQQLQKYK